MSRKTGEVLRPLIQLPSDIDGCWIWRGKINKATGYGHKQLGGKTMLAHRWVYSIFNGWIPEDMVIDHTCRNRGCVNPAHLDVVPQRENCRRGSGTKLTESQVREIKKAIPTLPWGGRKQLAAKYGVSEGLISDIKYGRAWAEL